MQRAKYNSHIGFNLLEGYPILQKDGKNRL